MTQDHEPESGHSGHEHTDERRTLGEISHTHPHTGNAFGDTMTFERGTTVAADGGERGSTGPADGEAASEPDSEPDSEEAASGPELRDVDHTPRKEADGANGVYERGHEGRDDEEGT